MTDLQARLDRAITRHLARVLVGDDAVICSRVTRAWIERFAALVEVRARLEVVDIRGCEQRTKTGTCIDKRFSVPCQMCRRSAELTAEAERLMEDA